MSEKEYIEREAAKDYARHAYAKGLNVIEYLDEVPTANVRPVINAHAIQFYNDPYTGRMFTTCSNCDGKINKKDRFCKHCGADMR